MGLKKNENIGSITVLYSEQKTGLASLHLTQLNSKCFYIIKNFTKCDYKSLFVCLFRIDNGDVLVVDEDHLAGVGDDESRSKANNHSLK